MRRMLMGFSAAILLGAALRFVVFLTFPPTQVEAQVFPIVRSNPASMVLTAGVTGVTTTPGALRATLVAWECLVQNDPDNTTDILIGDATTRAIQLKPGESITIPVANAATIFVVAVSGTPNANYLCR